MGSSVKEEAASFVSKWMTQDMAFRQSGVKFAEKYGVSRASRMYNESQSYIYFSHLLARQPII